MDVHGILFLRIEKGLRVLQIAFTIIYGKINITKNERMVDHFSIGDIQYGVWDKSDMRLLLLFYNPVYPVL